MDLLSNVTSWLPWVGIPAVGLGAAFWFLGGAAVLKIVATAFDIISPVLKAVFEGIVWLWQNVFWPGISNILHHTPTLATVIVGGWLLYTAIDFKQDLHANAISHQLKGCQTELKNLRKSIPSTKSIGKLLNKQESFWPF